MAPVVSKLNQIRARLQGTAAEVIPADYEVRCECGCLVKGRRGLSWKQSTCPECMSDLFLLPRNVYPGTDGVPNEVIGGGPATRLTVVLKELVSTGSQSDAVDDSTEAKQSVEASPREKKWEGRPFPGIGLPEIDPTEVVRRTFTPLRLLVGGMLVAVTLTGVFIWRQQQQETARDTWHTTTDAIPELLKAGNLQALEETLDDAVTAGRILGQHDEKWRRLYNLLQETRAVNQLAWSGLPALVQEALPDPTSGDPGHPPEELFQKMFAVDGFLDPAPDDSSRTLIDLPLMTGEATLRITLELPQLTELRDKSESGRFLFSFSVADVRRPEETGLEDWEIIVEPSSFVLFTSPMHCRSVGLMSEAEDPEIEALLIRQRSIVESSEEWAKRQETNSRKEMVSVQTEGDSE